MPSLQSLRRKIAAFKNTQKITKAMKMVAAAKLKRPQDRVLAARPSAYEMHKGAFDELYVVYNEFKSAIQQRVVVEKLFPVDVSVEFGTEQAEGTTGGSYLYEPDEAELLNVLVPKHFQVQTYRILLESAAAQHGARMAAIGWSHEECRSADQEGRPVLQQDPTGCDYRRIDGHRRRGRSVEVGVPVVVSR